MTRVFVRILGAFVVAALIAWTPAPSSAPNAGYPAAISGASLSSPHGNDTSGDATGTVSGQSGAPDSRAGEQQGAVAATLHSRPRLTDAPPKVSPAAPTPNVTRTVPSRPAVTRPPAPAVRARVGGPQVAIRATWYCGRGSRCTVGHPGGLYAAISPDLASWTGRLVRVKYSGRSVVVRVIDCDCATEHGIDLYSDAFAVLAPLSVGELDVTLELVP